MKLYCDRDIHISVLSPSPDYGTSSRPGHVRAIWTIETSPSHAPSNFSAPGFLCLVFSSRVHHVPRLCPRTSRPPSLPLLSSSPLFPPHPFSLCLVCLPSQLLSKKRGLFRIHAGRKQRYPRQQACARGTLERHKYLTPSLFPPP